MLGTISAFASRTAKGIFLKYDVGDLFEKLFESREYPCTLTFHITLSRTCLHARVIYHILWRMRRVLAELLCSCAVPITVWTHRRNMENKIAIFIIETFCTKFKNIYLYTFQIYVVTQQETSRV